MQTSAALKIAAKTAEILSEVSTTAAPQSGRALSAFTLVPKRAIVGGGAAALLALGTAALIYYYNQETNSDEMPEETAPTPEELFQEARRQWRIMKEMNGNEFQTPFSSVYANLLARHGIDSPTQTSLDANTTQATTNPNYPRVHFVTTDEGFVNMIRAHRRTLRYLLVQNFRPKNGIPPIEVGLVDVNAPLPKQMPNGSAILGTGLVAYTGATVNIPGVANGDQIIIHDDTSRIAHLMPVLGFGAKKSAEILQKLLGSGYAVTEAVIPPIASRLNTEVEYTYATAQRKDSDVSKAAAQVIMEKAATTGGAWKTAFDLLKKSPPQRRAAGQ